MRRREFITLVVGGAALASGPAHGHTAGPPRRVGFLGNSTAELEANLVAPFRKALRELGYVEGRDIVIEYRWAEGDYERFPALVTELIASGVEVIVTAGTPAAFAVKNATKSIPCVMVAVGDPVGTGLVASSISPDLEGKRLALLREMVPSLSHFAVLWNPTNALHVSAVRGVQAAADALHMKVLSLRVSICSNSMRRLLQSWPSGPARWSCWRTAYFFTAAIGSWPSPGNSGCLAYIPIGNWSMRAG